jgi:hypothetical protein
MSRALQNTITFLSFIVMATACDQINFEDQDYYDFLNQNNQEWFVEYPRRF